MELEVTVLTQNENPLNGVFVVKKSVALCPHSMVLKFSFVCLIFLKATISYFMFMSLKSLKSLSTALVYSSTPLVALLT